ncbi:MAG: TIM barrel protein, partial [Spirochaetota bacterium]
MQIAVCSDFFLTPCIEGMEQLADAGFTGIELICENPHLDLGQLNGADIDAISRLKQDRGLDIIVHAPFYDLNAASWNDQIREVTSKLYRNAINLAKRIGSPLVVLHMGDRSSDKMSRDEAIERNGRTLKE